MFSSTRALLGRGLLAAARRMSSAAGAAARPKGMDKGRKAATSSSNMNSPYLLVIPAIAFGLGTWQIMRKKKKEELIAVMEGKLSKTPTLLPSSLLEVSGMEYERVFVEGEFLHDQELIIAPRTRTREAFSGMGDIPTPGAQIITPFKRADTGEVILVNRGWVPEERMPPSGRADGRVAGKRRIEGIVRLGESKGPFVPENDPGKGEWHWIDIKALSEARNTSPILIDVVEECTPKGGWPLGGQTQINIRNEHMQYIITWYSLSAATLAMWYFFRRGPTQQALRRVPPPPSSSQPRH